jgi:hypothetical protein
MPFGFTLNESGRVAGSSTLPNRFSQIVIIGTSTTALVANQNVIRDIPDLRTFENLFGVSSPSYWSVSHLFANDQSANIKFICGKDPGATPTLLQNLIFGIGRLQVLTNLDSSIIICPEGMLQTVQTDRTAVFNAMEAVAVGSKQKDAHYWNTALATNTKALAITERALYSSPLGTSILCYEYIELLGGQFVPLAVHQAGYHLKLSRSQPFNPPSGYGSTIKGAKGIRTNNFVTTDVDWNDFSNNAMNIPVQFPDGSLGVWNAKTLATDPNLVSINSRTSFTFTANSLRRVSLPFLQSASDRNGTLATGLERALFGALQDLYQLGAFTSDNDDLSTAFRITPKSTTQGSKKAIRFEVLVRLIDTLELITVDLVNVTVIEA